MGEGYSFSCGCGCSRRFMLGAGFAYSGVQKQLRRKIRKGRFGEAYRKLLREKPQGAFSAEAGLYYCPECDELLAEYTLDFYERERRSWVELFRRPKFYYWMAESDGWKLTQKGEHLCRKCGGSLRVVESLEKLRCPRCHELLPPPERFMWD